MRRLPGCQVTVVLALVAAALPLWGQETGYVLGADDQVSVTVLDLPEITPGPVRIDQRGNINLPVLGRVRAAGFTVEQLEADLKTRLKAVLHEPQVTVTVHTPRSQPVSVLGAVRSPGVHQVAGRKTLYEVLSLAGGLAPDAGNAIKVTRKKDAGALPLPNATDDATGQYRIAQLNVREVMEAKNPQENITVLPDDVVSVPKADLVYVIGAVRKSGGFVLSEREKISVLQALSLAEGLDRLANAKRAKILRQVKQGEERLEIAVDLKTIMEGKGQDVMLTANDILFVPNNAAKSATIRGLEAAIQVGTGLAIYGRR